MNPPERQTISSNDLMTHSTLATALSTGSGTKVVPPVIRQSVVLEIKNIFKGFQKLIIKEIFN